MQIVRKKLSADEFQAPGIRYDPATDTVQTLVDGAWVDTPAADPRTSASALLPPRTSSDPKCDAAANMVAKVKSIVDYYLATAEQTLFVSGVLTIISIFFPLVGLIAEVLWAIADVLIGLGVVVVGGAMTSDVYDRLTCYFLDQLDSSGQLDQDGLDAVLAAVAAGESSTVSDVISAVFSGLGWVGINNAGATGSETGDCVACGWTWCWLGGDGLGDWLTPVGALGKTAGVYDGGTDAIDGTIINPENNVWANFYYEQDLHIKQVRLVFDNVNAGGSGSADSSYNCQTDLGLDSFGYSDAGMTDNEYTFTLNEDVHWIQFVMTAQVSMHVKRIEMQGIGATPTSGVDCTP